jgi:hypothetical protein
MGGRFSTYMRFVGNNDGGNNSLRSTTVLDAVLVFATIFTTNLSVLTNMWPKPSVVQALGTERGQNETPSVAERPLPEAGKEVRSGHEALGEQTCPKLPLTSSSNGFGVPATPPPTIPLPQLPQRSVVPSESARPPQPQPRQQSLTSWPSNSTIQGPWDGRSAYSAYSERPLLPDYSLYIN